MHALSQSEYHHVRAKQATYEISILVVLLLSSVAMTAVCVFTSSKSRKHSSTMNQMSEYTAPSIHKLLSQRLTEPGYVPNQNMEQRSTNIKWALLCCHLAEENFTPLHSFPI